MIGDEAFSYAGFTGKLELPKELRSIGSGSFCGCRGLTEVSFPDTLEHIKRFAFADCEGLTGTLTIPDSVYSIGRGAFSGCGITEVSFGARLRSVGEGAFLSCARLTSASFTGSLTPDYYGPEEKSPGFPEGCKVNALPGAASYREKWEQEKTSAPPQPENGGGGAAKEMPYLWTDGLRNDDFCGAGIYADVVLNFDGANIRISVNGRPMGEASYAADHNDYKNRIVHTEGFRCVDGVIGDLEFRDGYNRDRQLFAKLTGDDGEVRTVVFHTGSEESLYLDRGE